MGIFINWKKMFYEAELVHKDREERYKKEIAKYKGKVKAQKETIKEQLVLIESLQKEIKK